MARDPREEREYQTRRERIDPQLRAAGWSIVEFDENLSQGVKANVVFFTNGAPTEAVWIYDARTNVPGITKKDCPLTPAHFAKFETCYGRDPN